MRDEHTYTLVVSRQQPSTGLTFQGRHELIFAAKIMRRRRRWGETGSLACIEL